MKEEENLNESLKGVINTEVSEEMKKAYLDYAMSVIVSRAIPSIEDGLKPVQRRILYAMHLMGLKPGSQTKKSARVVGDVMGKFHPHGDSSIYDALVRMAQDFSLRYPLIFGQGNFGSIDGDPPAAMRYTETKLTEISTDLIRDIDKETVKFAPNFDNSVKEPLLLPGKIPTLLINGATGIAVGMATNIPPHNLTEVCNAVTAYIKDPNISIEEIFKLITGPDFPTGGTAHGNMLEMYKTGKGKIIMRGKVATETVKNKEAVVITEIPYMLNKTSLIEQIAKLVQDKRIKDLSDLRDESSKGKIRIVLELKKNANSKFIINSLFKYTRLQDSFNTNFIALVNGEPRLLNIKQAIELYVEHRKTIITNRTKYELKNIQKMTWLIQCKKLFLQC